MPTAEELRSLLVFDITDFEIEVVRLLETASVPAKYAAKQAVRHLNRAWKIREIDKEMAALRAVTAEEESAAAIFHAIKRHAYHDAGKLKLRNHRHKRALTPFFSAMVPYLAKVIETNPLFGSPRAVIRDDQLKLQLPLKQNEEYSAIPHPPLHFDMSVNGDHYDFRDEARKVAEGADLPTMLKLVDRNVAQRNDLLYARNEGVTSFAGDIDALIMAFKRTTFRNLIVFLLIDPHHEIQLFVQQTLDAFLKALDCVPVEITDG